MPSEAHGFLLALAATVVLIAVTATLGRRAWRRAHVASALGTAAVLVYTIVLAVQLTRTLEFPHRMLLVHRVFANLAAIAFVAVAATGIRLFRREDAARRRWHRRLVVVFAVVTALATVTGTYVLTRSRPRGEGVGTGSLP